jgi:hypothetical protein
MRVKRGQADHQDFDSAFAPEIQNTIPGYDKWKTYDSFLLRWVSTITKTPSLISNASTRNTRSKKEQSRFSSRFLMGRGRAADPSANRPTDDGFAIRRAGTVRQGLAWLCRPSST